MGLLRRSSTPRKSAVNLSLLVFGLFAALLVVYGAPSQTWAHPDDLGANTILVGGSTIWHIEQDVEGTTEYTLNPITGSDPGAISVLADASHSLLHPNDVEYIINGISPGSATVSVSWQHFNPDGTQGESNTFNVNITVYGLPFFTAIGPGSGTNVVVADASVNNGVDVVVSADFPGSGQFFTGATFNSADHASFSHGDGEFVYDIFGTALVGTGEGPRDITIFVQSNLTSIQQTFSVNILENTDPRDITFTPGEWLYSGGRKR
jgi:hypothetical protein